jgi:3-oxoacyl-[acyl-carrier protein] reductase
MTDDFGVAGKTALITGSGRNIGRAIVLELAARGADVVVKARSSEAEAVGNEAEGLGARSLVVLSDAAEKAAVERMRAEAEGGVRRRGNLRQQRRTEAALQGLLPDHRRGLARLSAPQARCLLVPGQSVHARHARPWLGRIVHNTEAGSWPSNPVRISDAVGEGGQRTLTERPAAALGHYGITVNDVLPRLHHSRGGHRPRPRDLPRADPGAVGRNRRPANPHPAQVNLC